MLGYLRHLANFSHIVEAGSMTAAAQKMESNASAMSDSVKILEAYFGEPLLERHKTGVTPTGLGHSIFEQSQIIVDAMEKALGSTQSATVGSVKISIPSELLSHALAPAIAHIHETYPEIHLILKTENDILDHRKYARDLYIRVLPNPEKSDLTILQNFPDKAILVGTKERIGVIDPHDLDAVSTLPLIGAPGALDHSVLTLPGLKQPLIFRKCIHVSSVDARIAMMRHHAGITACLASSVQDELHTGTLIRLLPNDFEINLDVVIASPFKRPSSLVQLVAQEITANKRTNDKAHDR